MKKLLLSPYSQKLRNEGINPKNFPWWGDVVKLLKEKGWYVVQIGVTGEKEISGVDEFKTGLRLDNIMDLVKDCNVWASVDNFLPHLCAYLDKIGVVIYSKSDPKIFGYPVNINLLKDKKYLRKDQYDIWEKSEFDIDSFVDAETVVSAIESIVQ
jgi:ADP-heptose:LPS heptosyltransferase